MPTFTEVLNLYLPGGGSLGIGGDDEAVDIDMLNQNFEKIDDFAGLPRDYRKGTNAERLALLGDDLFSGLTFWTTDTRILWVYQGSWQILVQPFADYVPTVSGLNPSHYTVDAGAAKIGKLVIGEVILRRTTAGRPTGDVKITLPSTPSSTNGTRSLGTGTCNVTNVFVAVSKYAGGSEATLCLLSMSGTALAQGGNVDAVNPTSANHPVGSIYHWVFQYEEA